MSIAEFKAAMDISATSLDVVRNPNTKKLFVSFGGEKFKCEQDISPKKPMSFIIPVNEDGEAIMDKACLINVTETDNVQFSVKA